MNTFHKYNAKVLRVVDGDTIDVTIFLGFKVKMDIRFRLTGFDAPETYRPKSEDEARAGKAATEQLKGMIDGKNVIIHSDKFGKYRYLATVYLPGKDWSVNDRMIKLGHIKKV